MPGARVPTRHTRRSIAMLSGAIVVALAALIVAWTGVGAWRRAAAVGEAVGDFYRSPSGGEAALRAASAGIDSFPEEPALLLARAAALAARARAARESRTKEAPLADVEHAADAFRALAEAGGDDDRAKLYRALGRLGAGVMALDRARLAADEPERRRALDDAEGEVGRAASLAPRRPEPKALAGVLALERGDAERAVALFGEAESASERPSAGGLLTSYAGLAEALLRTGAAGRAVPLLEKAVLVAPAADPSATPEVVRRLARAIARDTGGDGPIPAEGAEAPEAARQAIARATHALEPVEQREGYRRVPLFGLEGRAACEIRRGIGAAQARAGDLLGARRSLEQALRDLSGDAPGTAALRAAIARDLGAVLVALYQRETREGTRRELAQAGGEALTASADASLDALLDAGVLFARAGSVESALGALRRAEKIDASGGRLYRALGVAFDLAGRKADAVAAYKKAIDRAPGEGAAGEIEERIRRLAP
jgi:tetratricopeptide (TPR) repeat protein